MNIITLDFETFYSQTYSLSKMTTEEYIRGEEFEVIGVAVKVNDEETQWFSGTKEKTRQTQKKVQTQQLMPLWRQERKHDPQTQTNLRRPLRCSG